MILFSDAVFAIAITLLAIEIKVPEVARNAVNDHILGEKLLDLIPKFVGFLVSFFVIAIYWMVHHRTFGFVVAYNQKLIWLNMLFLLAIALMPFSSGFYSEYVLRRATLPVIFYVGNIVFLGSMSLLIWNYVANPKHKLSEGITAAMSRYFRLRAMMPPLAFVLTAAVYLFGEPSLAVWMPLLIPVFMRLIRKFYLKPAAAVPVKAVHHEKV